MSNENNLLLALADTLQMDLNKTSEGRISGSADVCVLAGFRMILHCEVVSGFFSLSGDEAAVLVRVKGDLLVLATAWYEKDKVKHGIYFVDRAKMKAISIYDIFDRRPLESIKDIEKLLNDSIVAKYSYLKTGKEKSWQKVALRTEVVNVGVVDGSISAAT